MLQRGGGGGLCFQRRHPGGKSTQGGSPQLDVHPHMLIHIDLTYDRGTSKLYEADEGWQQQQGEL